MRIFIILLLQIVIPLTIFAQKQNNHWYFGINAGLDFNSGSPVAIKGEMISYEGPASISDPEGQLLFYTNGNIVWDRNHNVMPHGTGLIAGVSSTQAASIVPMPKSDSKYFVFTTVHEFERGLYYSIIDMQLNGGLGDVLDSYKNVLINNEISEKVTSILHSNDHDLWIVSHLLNSDHFVSYLLTEDGLGLVPVVSSVGSFLPNDGYIGPVKASQNRTKLICAGTTNGTNELFDFDPATGIVSNPFDLNSLFEGPKQHMYGFEFSPNDSLLYITTFVEIPYLSSLVQVDLFTQELVVLSSTSNHLFGALQLGPDSKIYLTWPFNDFLGVIHKPNNPGAECQYEEVGVLLYPGTQSYNGLPQYVPYSFLLDTNYTPTLGPDTIMCNDTTLLLNINFPTNCDSTTYLWSTGDTTISIVVHESGTYWLTALSDCMEVRDTIRVEFLTCNPILYYDLDACASYMSDGSHMDYSEFQPAYPEALDCAMTTATTIYREFTQMNKHSCTPGVAGTKAMCISVTDTCEFVPDHPAALLFEVSIAPESGSSVRLTQLSFFEKSPVLYDWIDGPSGPNNYPERFGIRILKNGIEILNQESVESDRDWTFHKLSFLNNDSFVISGSTILTFEFFPYCPVGFAADVSAWDIDEIRLYGGCSTLVEMNGNITGQVVTTLGKEMPDVQLNLSSPIGPSLSSLTDTFGRYQFDGLTIENVHYVTGYKNDDVLNGVSTLDLIRIQKHLLGIQPFENIYEYIAADINRSGNVSAVDLIELRKTILGIYTQFHGNTSWRFGVRPQDIPDMNISLFKETGVCPAGPKTCSIDFTGIKIGDLTGDADVALQTEVLSSRSEKRLSLMIRDTDVRPNEYITVALMAEGQMELFGMQLALDLEDLEVDGVAGAGLPVKDGNYSIRDGKLIFSWIAEDLLPIQVKDTIMLMLIKPRVGGRLSDMIRLSTQPLWPEYYAPDLQANALSLEFIDDAVQSPESLYLQIYPNPAEEEFRLQFYLENEGKVAFHFYSQEGRLLQSFLRYLPSGIHTEVIKTKQITRHSGIIFCQVITYRSLMTGKVWTGQ